jgi:eukaryotic-like serine/threonine-protein kinase
VRIPAKGRPAWTRNRTRAWPVRLVQLTRSIFAAWNPCRHLQCRISLGRSCGPRQAYYAEMPRTKGAMYWARADGADEPVRLAEKPLAHPDTFSSDGKWLIYHVHGSAEVSVWTLPVDATDLEHPKPGQPQVFLQGPSSQEYASFSPDRHWIAYKSTESGQPEVYVRPFPGPGGKWLISSGGGTYPLWSRSGHELLYLGSDHRIQVADYTAKGNSFVAGKPRPWSPVQLALGPSLFDLLPDDKRMVMALPRETNDAGKPNGRVAMLLNFFDELRRSAPAGK